MASNVSVPLPGENLEVRVDSGDALDVRQFTVHERMSSLFTVSLLALSENPAIDFDAVVGQPATFILRAGPTERTWSGICSQLHQTGLEESGLSTYQITIVPALWLATQRRNYRMFQHMSEPDIVRKVLAEWGIEPDVRLTSTYKKRKYRVQYAESDFAFVSRMLEDAGIAFFFEHQGDVTRLVLADAPHLAAARAAKIPYKDDTSGVSGEYVTKLRIGQQVRPGRYTMREHDYRRAPAHQPLSSHEAAHLDVERRLERFHYTPGAFLFGTDKGEDSPTADDRGKTRVDEAEAALLAQKRLEAKRSNAKVCSFDSNVADLSPGVVISLLDHPRPDLGPTKKLLLVEVTHSGTSYGSWIRHCEARSADVPYRPALSTPKPKALGAESATVVGPPGEEIHTDEFGRVRVHFHWDRESQMNDQSSCWIHVSQPWGGAGFGGMNLPRVGQEVLVEFLGGDPDRPVIVGRVYTNLQKVPYKLPAGKTQSGWKSESSPGGGGSNELRFEDAKGQEQVYMQAERDLKRLTKNNEDIVVGNNLTKTVINNERETTGVNRTMIVGVNMTTQVGVDSSTTVGQSHRVGVSPPGGGPSSSATMKDKTLDLDSGAGATIKFNGSEIAITATTLTLNGTSLVKITGALIEVHGGVVDVKGVPIKLNC